MKIKLPIVLQAIILASSVLAQLNPDTYKTFEQITQENGFASENYTLTTPDDYILSLYRIPGKLNNTNTEKPVVLMMHCQEGDMMEWLWNDADKANALMLAREGYDVWLGNNRGNVYSNTHKTLTIYDKAYWDFYQQDMGEKDLPTFIDFILETTGKEKISYVGHSEGTTQMFLAGSLLPDYFQERINLFIALAPVANCANVTSPSWLFLASRINTIKFLLVDVFGIYDWVPEIPRYHTIINQMCAIPDSKFCQLLFDFYFIKGIDNYDRFTVQANNCPAGQSYRTFLYYFQMMNDKRYSLYDYGKRKNRQIYGTDEAPLVPIENFNIPVAIFSGQFDGIADPQDVDFLVQKLGEQVVWNKQYHLDHFSFAMALDMTFFDDAITLLNQYNNHSHQQLTQN